MGKALDKASILEILEKELPHLREKYGVVRLALYGSFASGVPGRKSDVDLLVELSRPLGLEFVALVSYLEQRLGRKVDLATFETLNRSLENPRYHAVAQNIQRTLTDVGAAAR
jgi:predicted nucleotidyltransferase